MCCLVSVTALDFALGPRMVLGRYPQGFLTLLVRCRGGRHSLKNVCEKYALHMLRLAGGA